MIKTIFVVAVALIAGFIIGTQWVAIDIENAKNVGIAARLIREDQMLTFLEKQDVDKAIRVQTEFLRLTLWEAKSQNIVWPSEIQAILERRQGLKSNH